MSKNDGNGGQVGLVFVEAFYNRTQATQPYSNVEIGMLAKRWIDPEQEDVATATQQLHTFCKNHVMVQLGAVFPHTGLAAKTAVLPLDPEGVEVNHPGGSLPEPVLLAMLDAGINPDDLTFRYVGDPEQLEGELAATAKK